MTLLEQRATRGRNAPVPHVPVRQKDVRDLCALALARHPRPQNWPWRAISVDLNDIQRIARPYAADERPLRVPLVAAPPRTHRRRNADGLHLLVVARAGEGDRKSTRLNSSHSQIS